MKDKILFFDIDGTLAFRGEVKDDTRQALKKCNEKHLVFICSGRTPSYQKMMFKEEAVGFICNNGRYAVYHDKVLIDHPIETKRIKKWVKYFNDHHYRYLLNDISKVYVGNFKRSDKDFIQNYHGWDEEIIFDYDLDKIKIYNFDVFFDSKEAINQLINDLKDDLIVNVHGDHGNSDLSTRDYTKGDAIKECVELLNLDLSNTYAFGDGSNDLDMMKAVEHPIAMGNAVPAIKEVSEYISSNFDKDGVINALKHYKLID